MENTTLSIAQIRFLMRPSKAKVRLVFSLILKELIYKGTLSLVKINSFPNDRSRKTQKYYMVQKGPHFNPEPDYLHEKKFLSPLEELDMVRVKNLTNYVLKNYTMPSNFIKWTMYNELSKDHYISGLPLLKTFGLYSLTSEGKQLVEEKEQLLEQQEEMLRGLIDGDKKNFFDAINECGANIFLMEERDPELYKNIISMVRRINQSKSLGPGKDLQNYMEAFNVDLGFLDEG